MTTSDNRAPDNDEPTTAFLPDPVRALLDERLRAHYRPPASASPPLLPETGELVGYLTGALRDSEARRLEAILARYPPGRARLRAVDEALETLRRLSWEEVRTLAAADPPSPGEHPALLRETAQSWLRIAAQRCLPAPADGRSEDSWWPALRTALASGSDGARAAARQFEARVRAALAHAARLHAALPSPNTVFGPAAVAAVRSAPEAGAPNRGTPLPGIDLPAGYRAAWLQTITTEADADDNTVLIVRVSFEGAGTGPADPPPGRALLQLREEERNEEPLLLGETGIAPDHTATWRIPGLGSDLLPLPPEALLVAFLPPASPAAEPATTTLRMAIPVHLAAADSAVTVLPDPAHLAAVWTGGQTTEPGNCRVTLSLPPPVCRAYRDSHRLRLELLVAPGGSQLLQTWSLAEPQTGCAFVADLTGLPTGVFRAVLEPGEPPR